jgi:hypothetical protein
MASVWKKICISGAMKSDDVIAGGVDGQALITDGAGNGMSWGDHQNFVVHNAGRYTLKHHSWNWVSYGNQWTASSSHLALADTPTNPRIEVEDMPLGVFYVPSGSGTMYLNQVDVMFATNYSLAGIGNKFCLQLFRSDGVTDEQTADESLTNVTGLTENMTSADDYKIHTRTLIPATTALKTLTSKDTLHMALRNFEGAGSGTQWYNVAVSLHLSNYLP